MCIFYVHPLYRNYLSLFQKICHLSVPYFKRKICQGALLKTGHHFDTSGALDSPVSGPSKGAVFTIRLATAAAGSLGNGILSAKGKQRNCGAWGVPHSNLLSNTSCTFPFISKSPTEISSWELEVSFFNRGRRDLFLQTTELSLVNNSWDIIQHEAQDFEMSIGFHWGHQ